MSCNSEAPDKDRNDRAPPTGRKDAIWDTGGLAIVFTTHASLAFSMTLRHVDCYIHILTFLSLNCFKTHTGLRNNMFFVPQMNATVV